MKHGKPAYICSDNGPGFIAEELREWRIELGTKPRYIPPAAPWEAGYNEWFHVRLRDEPLNEDVFTRLTDAR